jgi:hypothetical protein
MIYINKIYKINSNKMVKIKMENRKIKAVYNQINKRNKIIKVNNNNNNN